jgi:hypothetical protein
VTDDVVQAPEPPEMIDPDLAESRLPWPPSDEELTQIRRVASGIYRHWQRYDGHLVQGVTVGERTLAVAIGADGICEIRDKGDSSFRRYFCLPGAWLPSRRAEADEG